MASVRGSAIPLKPGLSFLPAWMQSPPGVVTKPFLGLHPISQERPDMGSPLIWKGADKTSPLLWESLWLGKVSKKGNWSTKQRTYNSLLQNLSPTYPSMEREQRRGVVNKTYKKQRPPLVQITNMLLILYGFLVEDIYHIQQIICKMWKQRSEYKVSKYSFAMHHWTTLGLVMAPSLCRMTE